MEKIFIFGPFVGGLILVLAFILAILWLLLPFFVYQIRNRLDTLISEIKQMKGSTIYLNTLVEKLTKIDNE